MSPANGIQLVVRQMLDSALSTIQDDTAANGADKVHSFRIEIDSSKASSSYTIGFTAV